MDIAWRSSDSLDLRAYKQYLIGCCSIARDRVPRSGSKSDREDYDSRNRLRKLVKKTLIGTNWRLTTDGISYRLGYLTGRLHAYEQEEDLKKLVMQEQKLKSK